MLKNKRFVVSLTAIFIAGAVGLYALGSHELSVVCVMAALFIAMAGIGNQNQQSTPPERPTEVHYHNQVAPTQEVVAEVNRQLRAAASRANNDTYRG